MSDKSGRLMSLDAFRGFDMMMIIGFDSMMYALGCWLYGESGGWLVEQFSHPEWFGLSFYDTIFPTFLFIAGISFPYSYAKQLEKGMSQLQIHLKIFKRAAILVMFGWVVNGVFSTGFGDLRYGSVLSKIGLGWMFAAIYYVHFRRFTRILICAGLIVGYAILLCTIVAPDYPNASSLSIEGNFIGWLDRTLMPNHIWSCTRHFDPESLFSTLPAAVTALLGMFAGDLLRDGSRPPERRALALVGSGILLLAAGWAFAQIMPVNKSLWSSSFVLLTGGGSYLLLAAVWYLVDVRQVRGWTMPLQVIGVNSIAVYLSTFLFGFEKAANFFCSGLVRACGPEWGTVVWHAGYLAVLWLVFRFLYRHNAIIKI